MAKTRDCLRNFCRLLMASGN